MREHLTELLPLLLVGIVLLVFQLTRSGGPGLHFLPLTDSGATATPKPQLRPSYVPTVVSQVRTPVPRNAAFALCDTTGPIFLGSLAELKTTLGARMGEALECERSVDDHGDTQQTTSTGLAYYRKLLNAACFTTGWDHWALQAGKLVHWTGDAVDPPRDAPSIVP